MSEVDYLTETHFINILSAQPFLEMVFSIKTTRLIM